MIILALLVLFLGLAPLPEAAAAERVTAKRLMERLRDEGNVELARGTVVTGDLVLMDGLSLTAEAATFEGTVVSLPPPRGTPPPAEFPSVNLSGSRFKQSVAIAELPFDTFDCQNCTFDRDADFHSVRANRMLLGRAVFEGLATFIAAHFEKELRLVDTRFDDTASFAAARINGLIAFRIQAAEPIVIAWDQFGNEWAEREREKAFSIEDEGEREAVAAQVAEEFRFWRRNFEALDRPEDAREANYALVKLERRVDFELYKPNTYAPYVLALASGYGTDPYRPFWVAVFAIIVFGVVFAGIGFHRQQEGATTPTDMPGRYWLPYGFAFSVQTFVPFLTIPGIKDSPWELRQFWWLESVEGVIGVLIFGVAAYSAAVTL